jgi:hypothetical protein
MPGQVIGNTLTFVDRTPRRAVFADPSEPA